MSVDVETGEIVEAEDSSAIVPVSLFGTTDPDAIIRAAVARATPLARIVRERKLYTAMGGGREHVNVEGWTLLGTLTGVFPVVIWSRPIEGGWEARVEARTLEGAVVGAAESMCTRNERNWESRDDFAIRSMAQTRATSKALRLPLGFIVSLAGFDATPAEEMTHDFDDGGYGGSVEEPMWTHAQQTLLQRLCEETGQKYPDEPLTRQFASAYISELKKLPKKEAADG